MQPIVRLDSHNMLLNSAIIPDGAVPARTGVNSPAPADGFDDDLHDLNAVALAQRVRGKVAANWDVDCGKSKVKFM